MSHLCFQQQQQQEQSQQSQSQSSQQSSQQQHGLLNGEAQDLSLPKERKSDGSLPRDLSSNSDSTGPSAASTADSKKDMSEADALRHGSSAFCLVRPKTEPGTRSCGSQL